MIIATIPILASIIGLLTYALSANPKVEQLGRITYACGLLVALFALMNYGAIKVLP